MSNIDLAPRGWGRAARRVGTAMALFGSVLTGGCRLSDPPVVACGPEFRDVIVGSFLRNSGGDRLGAMELRFREERNPTVFRLLWVVVSDEGMLGVPLRGKVQSIRIMDSTTEPFVELYSLPLDGTVEGDEIIETRQIVYPEFLPAQDFRALLLANRTSAEFRTTVTGSEVFTAPLALLFVGDWDRELCAAD